MEPITFDEFGIEKCLNENCNQLYNKDSIKLTVWLYGVILLIQDETHQDGDPIFGYSRQENMSSAKEIFGYIGITCPKCHRTIFYKKSALDVRKFKTFLGTWLKLNQSIQGKNGDPSVESVGPIPLNLRYYSPFPIKNEKLNEFDSVQYDFDEPEDDSYFQDDLNIFISGEEKDLNTWFCTYFQNKSTPVGIQTWIYWFKEQDIPIILELENKTGDRILPRYHYFSELMDKTDSLFKYKYQFEKQIETAKADYTRLMQEKIKNQTHSIPKKDMNSKGSNELPSFKVFLEKRQVENAIDPKMTGDFFNVLISDPFPLKDITHKPIKHCDYLWIKKDPFSEKKMSEEFIFGDQSDEFDSKAHDIMKTHEAMVDLARNNFTKRYVQEFLKDNLIDFLEEYEELFSSNQYSYAAVWELKGSYLEGLYNATKKGLREIKPYSFHFNSPGWTIKFNNQSVSGLRGKGLKFIHYLICNQNNGVNLFELNDVEGIDTSIEKRKKQIGNQKMGDKSKKSKKKVFGSNKQFFESTEMMDYRGIREMEKQNEELEKALSDAEQNNDVPAIEVAKQELDEFITYHEEYFIPGKGKKPRRFIAKENKDLRRRVELAISRAIEKIKNHNNELYWHFAQSIYGLPRVFYKSAGTKYLFLENFEMMYKPDPDIEWHLD